MYRQAFYLAGSGKVEQSNLEIQKGLLDRITILCWQEALCRVWHSLFIPDDKPFAAKDQKLLKTEKTLL